MKKCINCKHYFSRDICGFCRVNNDIKVINHPFFMGGKKCECYEKRSKQKFEYPKKEKMKKKIRDFSLNEILKTCGNRDCDGCPLKDTMICVCEIEWKEDQLDREIEVKDND